MGRYFSCLSTFMVTRSKKKWDEVLKLFFVLLLQCFFCNLSDGLVLQHTSLDTTVSVSQERVVYLTEGMIEVGHKLPFREIENTLDLISFRLNNLKYSADIDNFYPELSKTSGENITILRKNVPISLATKLCNSVNLTVLTLETIPYFQKLNVEILLSTEITVSSQSIVCTGPALYFKNEFCISFLIKHTQSKSFFRNETELAIYLSRTYADRTVYVTVTNTAFSLTASPNGIVGCLGSYELGNSSIHQRIHNVFHKQLYDVQSSLNAYLELNLAKLIDTVHSLASDSFAVPLEDPFTDLIPQILKLIPDYLPNHDNQQVIFTDFETFFRETMAISEEAIIKQLAAKPLLRSLPIRSQRVILGSLMQFKSDIKNRLGSFVSKLQGTLQTDIPNSLLFKNNQNPVTFIYLMKSLIPDLNENTLVESFIILQNSKTALLQDLAAILKLPILLPLISYNDFTEITERKSGPTLIPGELKVSMKVKVNKRDKRSWSSFWSSVFGSATEEELQKVYENEITLSKEEMHMQRGVNEIVKVNSQLLQSFKGVTYSLETLQSKQQSLFDELNVVLESEEHFLDHLQQISDAQDRIVLLTSEYQALQTKTILTINVIQKAQSLVLTVLNGEVDFSQISTLNLRSLLPRNFKLSLNSAKAEFRFEKDGYTVNYKIPKFSEPFYVYNLKQIPNFNSTWFQIKDLPKKVVMNQIHDTIAFEEVESYCISKNENYFCSLNSVTVRKSSELNCAVQLILGHLTKSQNFSQCRLEKVYYNEKQMYILKDQKLYLTSPVNKDELKSYCSKPTNFSGQVEIGLNVFSVHDACRYETAELIITMPDRPDVVYSRESPDKEIDLINDLSKAESMLTVNPMSGYDMKNLHDLLVKYKNDSQLDGSAIFRLEQEVKQLDSIQNVANFSPTKIDLINPMHLGNWMTGILWFCLIILVFFTLTCIDWILPGSIKNAVKFIFKTCVQCFRQRCFTRSKSAVKTQARFNAGDGEDSSVRIQLMEQHESSIPPSISIPSQQRSDKATSFVEMKEIDLANVYPVLPTTKADENELSWFYSEGPFSELRLSSHVKIGGEHVLVHFDLEKGKIKDEKGGIHINSKTPPSKTISNFLVEVEERPLPELVKDNVGTICCKSNPLIKFTKEGIWFDRATESRIFGLRRPTWHESQNSQHF